MLVHGDDFVLLADDGEIKAVEQLLKSKNTVKVVAVIGDGSSQQEAVILNRIPRELHMLHEGQGCRTSCKTGCRNRHHHSCPHTTVSPQASCAADGATNLQSR